jgi:hypothetical protein
LISSSRETGAAESFDFPFGQSLAATWDNTVLAELLVDADVMVLESLSCGMLKLKLLKDGK